jgi:hypothetical protein
VFAQSVTYDKWERNRDSPTTVQKPGWFTIEQRIRLLDGRQHTMVTIAGAGEAHMAVGGGGGRYVVYTTYDNLTFHNLVDPARGEAAERVLAGGQQGEYPARQVVALDQALEAARQFAEHGVLAPTVTWEEA